MLNLNILKNLHLNDAFEKKNVQIIKKFNIFQFERNKIEKMVIVFFFF